MTKRQYGRETACIAVSYYSSDVLLEMLTSLGCSTVPVSKTVVVNNAIGDDLSDVRGQPGVTVLDVGRNAGYGGAVNIGVAALDRTFGWIMVSNPDVVVHPTTLQKLLDAAERNPKAGTLGPKITDEEGVTYPSARELPALLTGIGHALLANVWPGNPWSRRYRGENRPSTETTRETGWLSGAFVLIRREAFDDVGGFDPAYFMYFEDVDLGRRMSAAGWSNLYVASASVIHHGAHSTRGVAEAMNRAHHKSAYRYLAARYSAWWFWPLRGALRLALEARERITRGRPL